jgi:hypothetical protein
MNIKRVWNHGVLIRYEVEGVAQTITPQMARMPKPAGHSDVPNNFKPRHILSSIPEKDWPIWAKAFKQFSKSQDEGIGDVVARIIGDEKSEAFKGWHLAKFNRPCGCTGRQKRWNILYPLK